MANTTNITLDGQVLTINPLQVSYLVQYQDGNQAVVLTSGKKEYVTFDEFHNLEELNYSAGGGGGGGLTPEQEAKLDKAIPSDSISTMEVNGDTLTINGTPFEGGSAIVYNTDTNILSGAKDQNGNDVTLYANTITIEF